MPQKRPDGVCQHAAFFMVENRRASRGPVLIQAHPRVTAALESAHRRPRAGGCGRLRAGVRSVAGLGPTRGSRRGRARSGIAAGRDPLPSRSRAALPPQPRRRSNGGCAIRRPRLRVACTALGHRARAIEARARRFHARRRGLRCRVSLRRLDAGRARAPADVRRERRSTSRRRSRGRRRRPSRRRPRPLRSSDAHVRALERRLERVLLRVRETGERRGPDARSRSSKGRASPLAPRGPAGGTENADRMPVPRGDRPRRQRASVRRRSESLEDRGVSDRGDNREGAGLCRGGDHAGYGAPRRRPLGALQPVQGARGRLGGR